jgi:hypothetical protein
LLTPAEEEKLSKAMAELHQQVVSNRILLKPTFADFDRAKSQHVT